MDLSHNMDMLSADGLDLAEVPMSRTHQYRKVMKPLLERKRRARINQCLDELKDLMVYALQSEGENASKLEKADILELTVRHLQKLKRQHMLQANPAIDVDRYRAGFTACASEVSRVLSSVPGVNMTVGAQVMSHLASRMKGVDSEQRQPLSVSVPKSQECPLQHQQQLLLRAHPLLTPSGRSDCGYSSGRESVSPGSVTSDDGPINFVKPEVEEIRRQAACVWRPF